MFKKNTRNVLPSFNQKKKESRIKELTLFELFLIIMVVLMLIFAFVFFLITIMRNNETLHINEKDSSYDILFDNDDSSYVITNLIVHEDNIMEEKVEEKTMKKICYNIYGYQGCGFFNKAKCAGINLANSFNLIDVNINSTLRTVYKGDILPNLQEKFNVKYHHTSPFVYEGCREGEYAFIGGCNEFLELARIEYPGVSLNC
eukprot:TRINITY_DN2359_c0_g1_i2.p1 TRINITY_DN2359_c0_g1~~TRINITY_DN2359_c0_g1_i2.p1  ORF type:complete len:202 (+),score=25.95 TRINITY_DN2359_c0_g1_i2:42-647(+)